MCWYCDHSIIRIPLGCPKVLAIFSIFDWYYLGQIVLHFCFKASYRNYTHHLQFASTSNSVIPHNPMIYCCYTAKYPAIHLLGFVSNQSNSAEHCHFGFHDRPQVFRSPSIALVPIYWCNLSHLAKAEGSRWPSTVLIDSIVRTLKSSASFNRPWSIYVDERLQMLDKVSGCSWPNTLMKDSITNTNSCLASFHCSWFQNIDARLVILVKVEGCSWPRTLFFVTTTCSSNSSAFFNRPYFLNVDARLIMLETVSGCSSPRALFLISMT